MANQILYVCTPEFASRMRSLLTRQPGPPVVFSTSKNEALLLASECRFARITLCSSLDQAVCDELRHKFQILAPETPVVTDSAA